MTENPGPNSSRCSACKAVYHFAVVTATGKASEYAPTVRCPHCGHDVTDEREPAWMVSPVPDAGVGKEGG